VLVEGMSKTELADWIKKIHESGDGSPRGLLNALGWPTLVAKTSNAVLLSAMDAFAQKNGLVKDKFKADEGEPDGTRGSSSSQPPPRQSSVPSWSEGAKSRAPDALKESPSSKESLSPSSSKDPSLPKESPSSQGGGSTREPAKDGPPREDVELSPPNEALLRELEAPSPPEGDWLEDPVSVPSGEVVDDLDVLLQNDPSDVTAIFHRPEDDIFGPNGAEASEPASGGGTTRNKATLPGLPGSSKRGKTVPPPLPQVEPPRPGGRNK